MAHSAAPSDSHAQLMFDLQMLRGNVYREYDGIAASLLPDGRHWQHLDAISWHILLQNPDGRLVGCARYRPIIGGFEQLACSKSALAQSPVTGPVLRSAFEQQFAIARQRGIQYGEAGAWAIESGARCSTAAVGIALMSFALAERLGGGMAITTATTRHRSSAILRRLGGTPLGGFAPYYEPQFSCTIEVLQFDINDLEAKFSAKLAELRDELDRTLITCPSEASESPRSLPVSVPAYLPARVSQLSAATVLQ